MDRLAETICKLIPPPQDGLVPVWAESIDVDMPIEVLVELADGHLIIGASAPTQGFTTRLMPTLHRARFRIVAEHGEAGH